VSNNLDSMIAKMLSMLCSGVVARGEDNGSAGAHSR
jgi:hypothetical protein